MKYFINGKEIKFGDKFFCVKECEFEGIKSTTTFEGEFTPEALKDLVDLDVIKVKSEINPDVDDIFKKLDKNIEVIEKIVNVLKENIG